MERAVPVLGVYDIALSVRACVRPRANSYERGGRGHILERIGTGFRAYVAKLVMYLTWDKRRGQVSRTTFLDTRDDGIVDGR